MHTLVQAKCVTHERRSTSTNCARVRARQAGLFLLKMTEESGDFIAVQHTEGTDLPQTGEIPDTDEHEHDVADVEEENTHENDAQDDLPDGTESGYKRSADEAGLNEDETEEEKQTKRLHRFGGTFRSGGLPKLF